MSPRLVAGADLLGWPLASWSASGKFGKSIFFFYNCGIISKSIAYVRINRAFQVLFRLALAVAGAGRCAVIPRALAGKKPD